MASINVEHVADLFARICGLSGASAHTDLVSRAVIKIQKALTVDELTSAQAVSCEYAAACEAAYEYALEQASCEDLVMSENGMIRKGAADPKSVKSADELRRHAFAELSGIAKLGGFVFEAVGTEVEE